jgi:hypothetical protein
MAQPVLSLPKDAPTADIEHHRQIEKAAPGRDVGDVSRPELVRRAGHKAAVDPIGRGQRTRFALRGPHAPAAMTPHDPR